jgi:hypothetical protein
MMGVIHATDTTTPTTTSTQSTVGNAAIRWLTKMLPVMITADCVAFMR